MANQQKRGMGLGGKILGLVLLGLLVSAGVGGIAFFGFSKSNLYLDKLANNDLPGLAITDDTDYQVARARRYEKEFFLFSSLGKRTRKIVEKQKGYHKNLVARYGKVGDNLVEMRKVLGDQGDRAATVAKIERAHANTLEALAPMSAKLLKGQSFLDVAKEYKVYKAHVHSLEDGVKELRTSILKGVDATKGEVADFRKFLITTLLGAGAAVIVLGLFIGLIVSNRISNSLATLVQGVKKVGMGNYENIEISTTDELAEIAGIINETMDRLKDYIQTDEERKQTQENVIGFLDVVHQSSEGDLTVRAPVTADVFGNIADAYNIMTAGLEDLLLDVRQNADQVGEESRRLMGIFDIMKQGADSQLSQVGEATGAVNAGADLSREVTEKAALAQEASRKVDAMTSEGHDLVLKNTEGMQLIRATVQVINRKMKSLADRMGEIETISQLISEVSSRTTILAMNASIEAASTGAKGTGFLVIADEIKKLADKSSEATKQINSVVKAIQTEAHEVTSSLEDETRTVEEQAVLTQETGGAFNKIEKSIQESNRVVAEIAELSERQHNLTHRVTHAMSEVSGISTRARDLVTSSSEISEGLGTMSHALLDSLSHFRLSDRESDPEEPVTESAEAFEVNLAAEPPSDEEIEAGLGVGDTEDEPATGADKDPWYETAKDDNAVEENLWQESKEAAGDNGADLWGEGDREPEKHRTAASEIKQIGDEVDFDPSNWLEPGTGEERDSA